MAEEAGLDLVLVAGNAQPPVCRIVDYGKFKYEQTKREKEGKAKKKAQELKGIKFRPGTAIGDLHIALRKAKEFLAEGHKVKFTVQFRAREVTHPELGATKLQWMLDQLGEMAKVDRPIGMNPESKQMSLVVSPGRVTLQSSKDGKAEDLQDSRQAV